MVAIGRCRPRSRVSSTARTTAHGRPAQPRASQADSMSTAMAPVAARRSRSAPKTMRGTETIGPVWTRRPARRSIDATSSVAAHSTASSAPRTSVATTTSPGSSSGDSPPAKPVSATTLPSTWPSCPAARRAARRPTPVRITFAAGAPRRTAWASNRIGAATTSPSPRTGLTPVTSTRWEAGLPLSASRAAARPLRTAPSIVAGHPVAVHAPASASPGIPVRWLGRRAPAPGAARNVAVCSRTTSKRSTRAPRARGKSSPSAGRKRSRSSSRLSCASRSAPDSETARCWPSVSPLSPVRSNSHWTGERMPAARSKSVTRRS